LIAAAAAFAIASPGHGQTYSVAAGFGQFDVRNQSHDAEGTWELRMAPRRLRLQPRWLPDFAPIAGLMATTRGTFYLYAGLRWELPIAQRWSLAPSFATGLYYRGEAAGKNLGGPLEFRSAVELSHQVSAKTRLGLALSHLSHAGLQGNNPGSESLVLTFSQRIAR
jgi:hypothetical protein